MKLFFESVPDDRANFERMQVGDSVTVKNYKTGDIYKFVKNSNNNTISAFTNVLAKNHHASPQQVWGWIMDSFYAKFQPEFEFKNESLTESFDDSSVYALTDDHDDILKVFLYKDDAEYEKKDHHKIEKIVVPTKFIEWLQNKLVLEDA